MKKEDSGEERFNMKRTDAGEGDMERTDTLLRAYKHLVKNEVRSLYLPGADRDDLIQEGMIGLMQAVRSYDPDKGASFESFARLCIERQLYKAMEAAGRKKHTPLNSYVSIYDVQEDDDGRQTPPLAEQIRDEGRGNPEDVILGNEQTKELLQSLTAILSPLERQVLHLMLQEKNDREIGALIGRSQKSVENTITRLKRKFRGILENP